MSKKPDENKALQLMNWITKKAVNGVTPLCSAADLAMEYQIDKSYPDDEERIESLRRAAARATMRERLRQVFFRE